jgi:phosphohistidine phosphatase SixA
MIVFVLRHADRKPEPDDALSPAGLERAKLLARMLSESGVSIAYCSDAARTRQTLEPLARLLGNALTIKPVDTKGPGGVDRHVEKIVQDIKSQPRGSTSVVVSHSNTVGPIVKGLGGGTIDPIGESEFDKLFVVFIGPTGSADLLRLRYGTAS